MAWCSCACTRCGGQPCDTMMMMMMMMQLFHAACQEMMPSALHAPVRSSARGGRHARSVCCGMTCCDIACCGVLCCGTAGFIEYWSATDYSAPASPTVSFQTKLDTDLFDCVKAKTTVRTLAVRALTLMLTLHLHSQPGAAKPPHLVRCGAGRRQDPSDPPLHVCVLTPAAPDHSVSCGGSLGVASRRCLHDAQHVLLCSIELHACMPSRHGS